MTKPFEKNLQYFKFCSYGFLKNLRFFEPFLILFFLEKGLSFTQIGTLYAIREISTNILEIPTGVIADALGRRRTMVSSFLAYIVSFIVFYLTESFAYFALAMLCFSFGEAFRTGTHKAMILDYLKQHGWQEHKVDYYGHTRSWSQRGSAISSLIAAGIVLYSGDYTVIFLASTLPYLLDLLLMLTYPKDLEGPVAHLEGRRVGQKFLDIYQSIKLTFSSWDTSRSVINVAMYDGYYKTTKDYLQPLLTSLTLGLPIMLGLDETQRSAVLIGVVYFVLYLLTARASRRSGKFAKRFTRLAPPLNFTLLLGIGLGLGSGLCYNINWPLPAVLLFMLIFIIQNLRAPIGMGYISEKVDHQIMASALSIRSQITSLITAGLALVMGLLADTLGLGYALITVSAMLMLITPIFWARN